LSLPVLLGAAALILGLVGFGRAVSEFGATGVIAFAKLILAPAVGVLLFFVLSAGRYTGGFPSNQAVKIIFIGVAVLTGMACAVSALFGVAWLVTR
jgi:hypothetical protein